MAIKKKTCTTFTIVCDRCGSHTNQRETETDARREAADIGFIENGDIHLCGECCFLTRADPIQWKEIRLNA